MTDKIFIIDDNSTDNTVKIAKANKKVKFLRYKFTKDTVLKFKLFKIDQQIKDNHQKITGSTSDEEALRYITLNKELEAEKKFLRENFNEMGIQ